MKSLIKKIIPSFLLNFYHFILALLGAFFYRFPSRGLKVIGVTGTNGKTTTSEMVSKIFEEAGFKVALLNSIRFKIGEKEEPNMLKMTMPGRFKIQKFLREAVNSGCQYAILEVTSEGIKQYRHKFVDFDIAVFTNLSPEHIEAHGSFEKYREAKGKLFQATKKLHIINLDDKNSEYFLKFQADKKITYGLNRGEVNNKKLQIKLNLVGDFNIYNGLAAIAVAFSQGIDFKTSKKALEKIEGIPGRMEMVIKEPFKVFVDYAFTPNALQKVYETLSGISNFQFPISKQTPNSKFLKPKLICVFGACGGGRDKWKRPVLGELAARYCQEIIITNEDPYDEDPLQILAMIKSGIIKSQFSMTNFYEILDRREAINKALNLAKPNDIVIITGKGCEPWICVAGGKKIPWDDRQVVREEFKKMRSE